jgi:hypothetical protein
VAGGSFSLAQTHEAFDTAGRLAISTLQQRVERTIECFMELVEAATRYPTLQKQCVEFLGERLDAAINLSRPCPWVAPNEPCRVEFLLCGLVQQSRP